MCEGNGPRVRPGVTDGEGPRVRPGVTAEVCDMVYALQRPAKPMLREITSFMISLVPP